MSRYVKTVAAADGSGGGGSDAGLTAQQACQYACKAVCDMFCTNLICPECRPYYNTLPTTTVNDWVVICHCACWTNCYGQNLVWCLDTSKYSGFKWCYCGVNIRGCCPWYATMGMAAKGVDCFCCCSYSYKNSVVMLVGNFGMHVLFKNYVNVAANLNAMVISILDGLFFQFGNQVKRTKIEYVVR